MASLLPPLGRMNQDKPNDVLEAFTRYTQAFTALDARAVARHFHTPALMITPTGVTALPDSATVERLYAGIMAELPPAYARTEFSMVSTRRLSDDLALVVGHGTWKTTADEGIMPFGMTYTLRREGDSWRIVVAVIHAAEGWRGVDWPRS